MSSRNVCKARPINPAWHGRCATAFLSGFLALALSGCSGYRLGPPSGVPAGSSSVQVTPFENRTLQPHLTDEVTQQMHKAIQQDGTYKLATHNDGDIVLSGVITIYDRTEVTLQSSDILTARDYRLTVFAHVTARERASGKSVLDQSVSGMTLIRVVNDLTSTERQAMPLLALDLAEKITALLAEGKW
jgi:hypothetical protein